MRRALLTASAPPADPFPLILLSWSATRVKGSFDGAAWESAAASGLNGDGFPYAGAYSPTLKQYLLTGASGYISLSSNGRTWAGDRITSFGSDTANQAIWNPVQAGFLVAGTGARFAISPNGTTWTTGFAGFYELTAAGYMPTTGDYVVANVSGSVFTSPNGSSWTERTGGSVDYLTCTASSGSIFLGGTSYGRMFSTADDGVTWTKTAAPFQTYSEAATSCAWCPASALFVMTSSGGKVATSPNGSTWTLRSHGLGSQPISSVRWVPYLSKLIMSTSAGDLALSSDGITWTSVTQSPSKASVVAFVAAS